MTARNIITERGDAVIAAALAYIDAKNEYIHHRDPIGVFESARNGAQCALERAVARYREVAP